MGPDKQNYVPAYSRLDKQDIDLSLLRSSKVATVISMFQKEGADAKTIAKRLGFADHRDLANYMKAKGYRWSSEQGNYQRVYGQLQERAEGRSEATEELQDSPPGGDEAANTPIAPRMTRPDAAQLERYLPLLEMLERNKDRLVDLIVPGAESGKVPRYAVPGIFVTKSVHMTNTLDSLVREYSKEKNISQRDIFAVALIEFFRRYGYEREIETLLGRTQPQAVSFCCLDEGKRKRPTLIAFDPPSYVHGSFLMFTPIGRPDTHPSATRP